MGGWCCKGEESNNIEIEMDTNNKEKFDLDEETSHNSLAHLTPRFSEESLHDITGKDAGKITFN